MQDQKALTTALRAYATIADAAPNGRSDWNSEGLSKQADVDKDDLGDAYVPSGNARFDAIVRAANPRLHYGFAAGYVQDGTRLFDLDKTTGAVVEHVETFDYIMFPPKSAFADARGYVRTLAHELTHWTQGEGRGGAREPAGMSPEGQFLASLTGRPPIGYVQEELTAEIGATLLLDAVGEDVDMPERAHYIANWLSAAPPEDRERLTNAAEKDAQRAVNWLLSLA